MYRTTPLRGVFTRMKVGSSHDGRVPNLDAAVNHCGGRLGLNLTAQERRELIEFLTSLQDGRVRDACVSPVSGEAGDGRRTMESRAKLLGHPTHQMLIVFPLGLLAMAIVFDVLAMMSGNGYWSEIAFWMIAAGVVTGLLWLGGELVDRLAIGVDDGAHPDAPSSLSVRRIRA